MPEPERRLHAVEGTGEIDDGLAGLAHDQLVEETRRAIALNEGLTRDLEAAEKDMRSLRASRDAYKGQVTRLMTPKAGGVELVESLLGYWLMKCHGPDSSVEVPIDGKRGDAVRATLRRLVQADKDPDLANPDKEKHAAALADAEQRAAERIRAAIDGAAQFPFEGKYAKRYPEQVPGSKRKVDLIYILRDEVKMEQFERLHDEDERRLAYRADLHRRLVTQPNLRAVLASFDPDHSEILARAIRWCRQQQAGA
jgi:hypothetical protein